MIVVKISDITLIRHFSSDLYLTPTSSSQPCTVKPGSNAGSVAFQVQQLYPPRYLRCIRASISALPALNTHEQPCYLGMRFR